MTEGTRVLLADDDDATRRAVRAVLEKVLEPAAHVDEAPTGEDALRLLAAAEYDLVLTDHHMMGVTGVDVLEATRRDQPLARRILMTGRATVELAQETIERTRAHAFLVKPLTPDEFESRLATLVRNAMDQPLL